MQGLPELQHFVEEVDQAFRIETDVGPVKLTLIEAVRTGQTAFKGGRVPFSLLFLGPQDIRLNQGTFQLHNAALGSVSLFLVPVGPDENGEPLYEAVFA